MILFYQAYDALLPTFKNFPITITISPCMPMYSLTCVQKGYMVINPVDGC